MKILVTGGAGYLGSVIIPKLIQDGHSVVVIDNLKYGQRSLLSLASIYDFEFIQADAREERILKDQLKKVDAIVPLAALVGAPACDHDPILAHSLNVESIKNILQIRSHDQIIIYPTTNSGYGTKSGDVYCTEDTPLEPISLYGKTKVEAEKLILNEKNTLTLRLATVFGVSARIRIDLLVNHFVYLAVTQGYIVIYEKHFKRNFVYIRDVADCFSFAINNFTSLQGGAYNFGLDDANYSKEELANIIKKEVPNFMAVYSEIGEDPDKRNYIVSNQKLKGKGFSAVRTVHQGVRELINAYRMIPEWDVTRNA